MRALAPKAPLVFSRLLAGCMADAMVQVPVRAEEVRTRI